MGREAKEVLADYLSIDFGSLGSSTESPGQRLSSETCVFLGDHVYNLLRPSAISPSFRSFIITFVRMAFAYQTAVPDEINPESLELTKGSSGIYDSERALEIEFKSIHVFVRNLIASIPGASGNNLRNLEDYVNMFELWAKGYYEYYGKDPLVDNQRRILFERFSTDPSYLRNLN